MLLRGEHRIFHLHTSKRIETLFSPPYHSGARFIEKEGAADIPNPALKNSFGNYLDRILESEGTYL